MCEKMIKPVERIKLEIIIVKKWFYSTVPELLLYSGKKSKNFTLDF